MNLNNLFDYYIIIEMLSALTNTHLLVLKKMQFYFLLRESCYALGGFHGYLFFKWWLRNPSSFYYVALPFWSLSLPDTQRKQVKGILGTKHGVAFQQLYSHCLCLNEAHGPKLMAKKTEKCVHLVCIGTRTGFWVASQSLP